MLIEGYKVYSSGGIFDWVRYDRWNQRRSQLTHTHFGNRVLAIWADSSRWDSVINATYWDGYHWSAASRQVWEGSFKQWKVIKRELLGHARRINNEYQLFRKDGGLDLGSYAWTGYCTKVAHHFLSLTGRYDDWLRDVEQLMGDVDKAAKRVSMLGRGAPTEVKTIAEAREQLLALSEAGKALKQVYSGRGYFNYGESD